MEESEWKPERGVIWDGASVLCAGSTAAVAAGAFVLPWMSGRGVFGEVRTTGLFSLVSRADTDGAGVLDVLAFGLPPLVYLLALALVAGMAVTEVVAPLKTPRPEPNSDFPGTVPCLIAAAWTSFITWRVSDAVDQVSAVLPIGRSVSTGPGGVVTSAGLIGAAVACQWAVSRTATPGTSAISRRSA